MKKFILAVFLFSIILFPVSAEDYEIKGNETFNTTVKSITSGDFSLNPIDIINGLFSGFFKELNNTKNLLKTVLVLSVAGGIVRILSSSFEGSATSETAGLACFLLISLPLVKIFSEMFSYAAEAVHNICDFITKFEPIFISMLITSGAVTQAAAFQPVLVASVYVLGILIDKCILPVCCFSAILAFAGNISDRIEIETLTKFLSSVSKWLLTGLLTLFSAILSLYGFSTKAFNTVATKGLKFAVGSLVPIVGGILSDTVETVLSGANLLKNAVGTAGMITLFGIAFSPALKILIIMLLLKATAAIIEPFSEKRIVKMLLSVSESVKMLFASVVTATLLFVISISVILLSSGVSF